jgi:hypothetical protein
MKTNFIRILVYHGGFLKCKDQEVSEVKHDTSSKRALEPVEPIPLPKKSRLSVKMIWFTS